MRWTERMVTVCWIQWNWRNIKCFEGCRLDLQRWMRQVVVSFDEDGAASKAEELHVLIPKRLLGLQ